MEHLARPKPPPELLAGGLDCPAFLPARDVRDWLIQTFIEAGGPLANEDHQHLYAAQIGVVWAFVPCIRGGRRILGQCEFKPPGGTMGKWQRERARFQLRQWFGADLDFLLTLDAEYAATCSDVQFCALVEHELYHAGQAEDEFGAPKFIESTGMPVFRLRPHDVEEFTGVVRRYGAVTPDVARLVEAADNAPLIGAAEIAQACGTCHA